MKTPFHSHIDFSRRFPPFCEKTFHRNLGARIPHSNCACFYGSVKTSFHQRGGFSPICVWCFHKPCGKKKPRRLWKRLFTAILISHDVFPLSVKKLFTETLEHEFLTQTALVSTGLWKLVFISGGDFPLFVCGVFTNPVERKNPGVCENAFSQPYWFLTTFSPFLWKNFSQKPWSTNSSLKLRLFLRVCEN